MKLGMVLFDLLSLVCIASLWGGACWAGAQSFAALAAWLWWPVALVCAVVAGLLALIAEVGVIHRLLPRVKPGRYTLLKDPMFFIWVSRFILQRALLAPGLGPLLFQFNTLRFLALRALGAQVALGASMSSDADILDPWLLRAEEGATVGTGCLVSGHYIDRGKLVLGEVVLGQGSLLAARVVVGPGVVIGRGARVLTHAMIGVDAQIGDGATIGADSRVEALCRVGAGVTLGAATFMHRAAVIERDTLPREVIGDPSPR